MNSCIRWTIKTSKVIGRYFNSNNITEFLGEIVQELTFQGIEDPESALPILLVIPVVASVAIAGKLFSALWGRTRNRQKTEVKSVKEAYLRG